MGFLERFEKIIEFAGSAYKLSKNIGTSQSVISNIRKGKTKPSFDILKKILLKYEAVDMNWLLTGNGEMNKKETTPEKKGESVSADIDTMKIQFNYSQDIIESKEKIIKLLEEAVALKDDKLKTLTSDNKNLKILLKDCRKKKNYAPPAE